MTTAHSACTVEILTVTLSTTYQAFAPSNASLSGSTNQRLTSKANWED
jgi:hypothetical protein